MKSIVVIRREGKVLHDQAQWLSIEDINFTESGKSGERFEPSYIQIMDNLYIVRQNDQIAELNVKTKDSKTAYA
ncbi:hypothetical protein SAMN04488688_1068 [Paenibacillus sp. cl141a]|nr:hypothetical protein SAMN04488688_1068 [Paenibacillus sp. cl141a]